MGIKRCNFRYSDMNWQMFDISVNRNITPLPPLMCIVMTRSAQNNTIFKRDWASFEMRNHMMAFGALFE